MHQELTTDDVHDYVNKNDRIFVRLPVMSATDIAIDRAIGFLLSLEAELKQDEMDVIIFSSNSLVHSRIVKNEGSESKARTCEKLVYRLHLDYLPYTELIVSVPKNENNEKVVRRLCLRYGINF